MTTRDLIIKRSIEADIHFGVKPEAREGEPDKDNSTNKIEIQTNIARKNEAE